MKLELRSGVWKVDVESAGDRGIHWVHLRGAGEGASIHARMGIQDVSFRGSIEDAFTWPEERRLDVDGTSWRIRPVAGPGDGAAPGPAVEARADERSLTLELPAGVALGAATDAELTDLVRGG